MGRAAARRAARPGRHVAAGEAGEQVGDLVGRSAAGRARGGAATHRSVGSVGRRRVPAGARRGASTRSRHAASTRSVSTRPARERGRCRARRPTVARSDGAPPCGRRVMASTVSTSAASAGGRAEHVEAAADLGVLQRAQVAVDVEDQVVEDSSSGGASPRCEVAVDLGRDEHVPHLGPDRRQLGRVHRRALGVAVEELLQLGQLVVGVGPGQRRRQVVDDDGVGPALGLRALARVVDDERVEQRHVGDRDVREAGARQGQRLAGQPLQRAVLAEVDDGVGAPAAVGRRHRQPAVERQVVVGRREVGGVVRADRVGAEAARRLDRDEHAAEVDAR